MSNANNSAERSGYTKSNCISFETGIFMYPQSAIKNSRVNFFSDIMRPQIILLHESG